MPDALSAALNDPQLMTVWHNGGMFDSVVLQHALGIDIPLERIHDTMVQAYAHSLPGSLDALCEVLNVPTDQAKDKTGRQLIQLFCKTRPKTSKIRRATRDTHPEEWRRFVEYAAADIEAMRVYGNACRAGTLPRLKRRYGVLTSASTAVACAWISR